MVKKGQLRCPTPEQASELEARIRDLKAEQQQHEQQAREETRRKEEERKAEVARKKQDAIDAKTRTDQERKEAAATAKQKLEELAREKLVREKAAQEKAAADKLAAVEAQRKDEAEAKQKAENAKRAEDALLKSLQAEKEHRRTAEKAAAEKAPPNKAATVRAVAEEARLAAALQGQNVSQPPGVVVPARAQPINVATAREVQPYSVLAADVYADKSKASANFFGFRRINDDWKTTLTKSGLNASQVGAFANSNFYGSTYVNPDKKEIVVAFRGSLYPGISGGSLKDWATNIGARYLPLNGVVRPTQYEAALAYAKAVRDMSERDYKGFTIKLTGHSEGGSEASYVGNQLGLNTYTFNAARNSFSTQESSARAGRQVNVYTIKDWVGDPDTTADIARMAGKGLLPGNTVFVSPTGGPDLSVGERHSMDNVEAGLGEFLLRAERGRR
ncbi:MULTISPECIES: hypothetical protein [unclassified Bradyrhizobium]|uniref:hypothetical protein n=1 Tax=unclassified Bradyrhizobium TaxID=2631580 RepID=UPI002916DF8C|nr:MULTISPECIES: hypothetical protein [unclassified Bradyrhizobium]